MTIVSYSCYMKYVWPAMNHLQVLYIHWISVNQKKGLIDAAVHSEQGLLIRWDIWSRSVKRSWDGGKCNDFRKKSKGYTLGLILCAPVILFQGLRSHFKGNYILSSWVITLKPKIKIKNDVSSKETSPFFWEYKLNFLPFNAHFNSEQTLLIYFLLIGIVL
jgi:hypothetical protein